MSLHAERPPTHLLYLHGFRSSPQSFKARRLQAWLHEHQPGVVWWCPQLPASPQAAMAMVEAGIAGWPRESMAVLGSSLGGFYATWVAQRCGCPAVLMNPAVDPARDLAAYIGELTAYHDPGQRIFFRPEFIGELRAWEVAERTDPDRILAIVAKGDELLDWREMVARYPGAHLKLLEGSDHALSDFEDHLPGLLQFLGLLPRA